MELSKTTWWMLGGTAIAGITITGYWLINYRLKKQQMKNSQFSNGSKQVVKTVRNDRVTRQVPDWNAAFDMNYKKEVQGWVTPKKLMLLDEMTAKKYAEILKKAKGVFNDDEKAVARIFSKELQDKVAVSSIVAAFWSRYKTDLWEHLQSFLSSSELQRYVTTPVNQLPNYTIS